MKPLPQNEHPVPEWREYTPPRSSRRGKSQSVLPQPAEAAIEARIRLARSAYAWTASPYSSDSRSFAITLKFSSVVGQTNAGLSIILRVDTGVVGRAVDFHPLSTIDPAPVRHRRAHRESACNANPTVLLPGNYANFIRNL